MGILYEMARFAERKEPEILDECLACDQDIYEGQFCVQYDDGYCCDAHCLLAYLEPQFVYAEKR